MVFISYYLEKERIIEAEREAEEEAMARLIEENGSWAYQGEGVQLLSRHLSENRSKSKSFVRTIPIVSSNFSAFTFFQLELELL